MIQLGNGSFTTNDNHDDHIFLMCSGEDFDKWKNGEMFCVFTRSGNFESYMATAEQLKEFLANNDNYKGGDVTKLNEEELKNAISSLGYRASTYKEFIADYDEYYDQYFEDVFTTPSGERVVMFGEYSLTIYS